MKTRAITTVRLVCWDAASAKAASSLLRRAGFRVVNDSLEGASGMIAHFRQLAPDVVVIDLDRLPSHGREVAMALRKSKATRRLPIVFAGGAPEKVARMNAELPDTHCCRWEDAAAAVPAAIRAGTAYSRGDLPLAPSTTPRAPIERGGENALLRKLGITAKTRAAIVSGDDGLREIIGQLPEGAVLQRHVDRKTTLALFAVRSRAELEHAFALALARLCPDASLWIVHPKQSSPHRCDFNQNDVRAAGLSEGFVDYKVCAVDEHWSGLKFKRRQALS